MAKKGAGQTHGKQNGPALEIDPGVVREGDQIILRGEEWKKFLLKIELDGKAVKPIRMAQGDLFSVGMRPDATGTFVLLLSTFGIQPGKHEIAVASVRRRHEARITKPFEVVARPPLNPGEEDEGIAYWRALDFFNRRFGHIGFIPPGMRETQMHQIRFLREQGNRLKQGASPVTLSPQDLERSIPVPGVCNWNPVGSGPVVVGPQQAFAGRALSITIDSTTPGIVYIGTASGGLWKSTDNGATWSPKTDYATSLAISTLAIDPNNNSRIFAGTGEYNYGGVGAYFGNGILYSEDAGNTWIELATPTFERAEISRIVFDPTDATSQRMFLSSSIGVYESTDGGVSWTQLRAGSASDLVAIAIHHPSLHVELIAAFYGSGLWTTTWAGSTRSSWTQITSVAFPVSFTRIALGQSKNNPRSIFAAFSASGSDLAGMASTVDGGVSWHSVNGPASPSGQTWYNFHISVHPDDPHTVYYGEKSLWKTTTGNAPWTNTQVLHLDQHAFAFDPTNPDIIWACNDGGIYRSEDGGGTWSHRNRDLATLQYVSVAAHPQWEAIMLGGTQDNGAHRYLGDPAWEFADAGDAGFTAIDPNTSSRMYHGFIYKMFYRSDGAGAAGTWVSKTGTITGDNLASEFYPPFVLDPSDANVCYFGYDNKLWRSPDNADTWSPLTASLVGYLLAIAVHPVDSTIIYVSTTQGHVYRVQKTGATWALADVTTTDLTGPDLPAGVFLSDIAVDRAGTVWVTVTSVLWAGETGAFANNHVYRRLATAASWETRTTGLAQADPIHTIVIDPTNNNRLFCGGDVGVFRTEDAGSTWMAWDEGLPNVAVLDLVIQNSRRLLRAATYGRSVWERPIDTPVCPLVDLYMRDNILDTGRVQPTPSDQPNPLDPSILVYWWESVDIKVDAPAPSFQTPLPITDYLAFASEVQHRNPARNRINRFYVQMHNRGVNKATGVQVRAFFADTSAGFPTLPADFWSGGNPFNSDPSGTDWTPVGPARTIAELEPAEPGVVEWDWFVPSTASTQSCFVVVATCIEDPLNGSGVFDVETLVPTRKQVTLKKLHVDDPLPITPF